MIIYGYRSKQLASDVIAEKCPDCGEQNCIDMHVFQRYAHIFWLPMFPLGKMGISQCDKCKVTYKNNKMTSNLRFAYLNMKDKTRTPIWMFTGLILLGLGIVWAAKNDKERKANTKKYITALQQGDILFVQEQNEYTKIKIAEVVGDTVYYVYNKYSISKKSKIYKIENGDYSFDQDTLWATKAEMKERFDKGEIFEVKRK